MNEDFLNTSSLFSMIRGRIRIRTNKFWTWNNIWKSYTISLATNVAFLLAFLCFATRELKEIPNLPAPDDLVL